MFKTERRVRHPLRGVLPRGRGVRVPLVRGLVLLGLRLPRLPVEDEGPLRHPSPVRKPRAQDVRNVGDGGGQAEGDRQGRGRPYVKTEGGRHAGF